MQNLLSSKTNTSLVFTKICDNNISLDKRLHLLLNNLGIPANVKGYYYIKEGLELFFKNSSVLPMTTVLYPQIAEKFNTNSKSVERAIRHGIELFSLRGNAELIDLIFGYSININKGKPTNSEFFAGIYCFMNTYK